MELTEQQLKTYRLTIAEKYLSQYGLVDAKLKASIKKEKDKTNNI